MTRCRVTLFYIGMTLVIVYEAVVVTNLLRSIDRRLDRLEERMLR